MLIYLLRNTWRIVLLFSWGIRQISGFTIGDWKYSKVQNPVWHKMALTWPVDADGDLIPVSFIFEIIRFYKKFFVLGFTMAC
jgi:hypothetical protein